MRAAAVALVAIHATAAAAPAQIDPSGRWQTWHTEHFRVHARAEHQAAAEAAAREAEWAYALLSAELVPPRGRIDLTLHDNTDRPDGSAAVFPSNRVSVSLTPPADALSLARYDNWLRQVIVHELSHIFHLDRVKGVWRGLQYVFGRAPGLFPNAYRPSWVSEGLATYYESRFTAGGRLRAAYHDQVLVASAATWLRPADATFATPRWPGAVKPYAWGSRFFAQQAGQYGDSLVPRFVEASSGGVWPFLVSAPLVDAGGSRVREGWERVRRASTSVPADRRSSDLLVRGLRTEPRPRISPDGRHVAYLQVDGKHPEQVVIVDLAGRDVVARRTLTAGADLAWSDESLIVSQLEHRSPVEVRSDLYRWMPGASWSRLSSGARLTRPFGHGPDGVGAVQLGTAKTSLVLVGRGGTAVSLAAPPGDDWARVAVSPDGSHVAAGRHRGGQWDIVVWEQGAPETILQVTDDPHLDADPVWAADGSAVLFSSERNGLPQIYAYSLETATTVQLTAAATGAREPALHPDGTLYYSTVLADGFAIVAARPGTRATPAEPSVSSARASRAPVVGVRRSGFAPWAALRPHYWSVFFYDGGDAGTFVGGLTSGSDPIGRSGYAAIGSVDPEHGRFTGELSMTYSRWRAVGLDASVTQVWGSGGSAVTPQGQAVVLAERERRAQLGVTARWRRWRQELSGRVGAEIGRNAFFDVGSSGFALTDPLLAGAVVSIRHRHVERPALSVSPENGVAVSALYRRRWELGGAAWSNEFRGTVAGYAALPLPGFARWVVAARLAGAVSGGPARRRFALGGTSGGAIPVVPGVRVGGERDFPLRGYPSNRQRFTRVVTATLEARIPLLLVGRGIWGLPVALDRLSIAIFAEAGGGWQAGAASRPTAFRGAGAELVVDLGSDYQPVRIRLGAATALRDGLGADRGDVRLYAVLGPSF